MASDTGVNNSPAADTFVHLHLHSHYSLLDGGNRIASLRDDKDRIVRVGLVDRVKELGMSAVAITDHGNLFGAVEFYLRAKEAGIKPVLGIEAYVAPGDRRSRERTGVQDGGYHLVLLAENLTGWKNLLKLSSDSYLQGFYYKPRMDKATLERWSDGLIAINGHLGSSIAALLVRYVQTRDQAHFAAALDEARWHQKTFGVNDKGQSRFFIELQRHDTPEQEAINEHLVRLARELDLPLVCDNDAHFLHEEDYDAHDTLCCISMGKTKAETNRLRYSRQLYVKSPGQMAELFADYPQAIANTRAIADRCNVELDLKSRHTPVVQITRRKADPKQAADRVGSTAWFAAICAQYELQPFDATKHSTPAAELKAHCDAALRELAEAGALWRYGETGVTPEIRARLERELRILADKNISAYFLIVWDFCNEARRRGIPVNARGSGVGTMVGYCLGLSNACPIRYGLLFERFTDPDRSEYPDIDIDICQDGRQAIIDYVRQKYGHVAQIITFGTLKARAAIRDVGRVLNLPLSEVDRVCKLVGDGLNTTIESALAQEPDLKQLYEESAAHRELLDTARKLEGLARHAGVHAAGVVIATQPLENIVPLYKASNNASDSDTAEQIVTQWDGPTCEKVGLLKMDFLGLRTLSIIERAKSLIRATLSPEVIAATVRRSDLSGSTTPPADPLDLDRLTYDDQKVLDLFRRGETAGIFQFESGGMRNTILGMKPDRLEDLIAANALFRPGPMDLIPDYNNRKHGRQAVPQGHPIVAKFTAETYGIMVYQEQVMQIVHELGDIPLRAAYSLIKAISKKKTKEIDAVRPRFVQGAEQKGLAKPQAEELFDLILKFAGYGFNKSHSTGYAITAYQTAYLKTYFPVQYMAALLSYESVSTDKVVEYIAQCRSVMRPNGKRGIDVRPPDINLSDVDFTVVFEKDEPRDPDHGHIRFGLSAVKGVGDKAIAAVIAARSNRKGAGAFKSLLDFCERVPMGAVNRATLEALIKCGAFDSIHGREQRAALVQGLEAAMQAGQRAATDRDSGQLSFFGGAAASPAAKAHDAAFVLPRVEPWSPGQTLAFEKSVLGFYVSSHPLDEHRPTLDRFTSDSVAGAKSRYADTAVIVGGMLSRVRPTLVKNGRSAGQKMAMITLEQDGAALEGVVFSEAYALAAPLLELDRIVILKGRIDRRREEPNLIVESVVPVERAAEMLTEAVRVTLRHPAEHGGRPLNGELVKLKTLLRQCAGAAGGRRLAEVLLEIHQAGKVVSLRINGLRVAVDADLPSRVLGVMQLPPEVLSCELIGPVKLPQRQTGPAVQQAPLMRRASADEEVCASIDRY